MTVNCPACTSEIPDHARFCAFCGSPLRSCPSCGRGYVENAQFCGACGTTLARSRQVDTQDLGKADDSPFAGEDDRWLDDDRDGIYGFFYSPNFPDIRHYLFEGDVTIGAGDKNDIVVDKPAVSWNHALLVCRNERVRLQDSASTNGTYVNEVRLSRPRDLRHGDLVRFGNVEFQVWLKPQIRNHRE